MTARPVPADFAGPPAASRLAAWYAADREARPARLERLRARFGAAGVDAYFGVRREHMRYLTGFTLADGEEKVAGNSGQFLVGGDEVVVLADSRYTIQARREAPDARLFEAYRDLPRRWPELVASAGARRVAVEAGFVSHTTWQRLAEAAPAVELVPVEGWVEADRAVKEPAELERVAAACAVADRALATLLPEIRAGVTEAELALRLEWLIRTGGAEALAFDVACLSGPEAALPHGAPGDRPVLDGQVLLFDFGAQVAGYRSDMTRTLFVGEPAARDLEVYGLVARAQAAAIEALEAAVGGQGGEGRGATLPSGRAIDTIARGVITAAGHGDHFRHGTGHGIGLATHESPSLGKLATEDPLPSPTVFSVEPGVYLEGEMGVRIEDLIVLDAAARRVERLTRFPREVLVVGG
ncbi:MAG: Xaa-Pro peptidase family protein [Candidatus Limnocylindrales bacterium]|nr:Xaa-Pro peptidase family protein [Candidatus Limnocylindrales bacterium]